ncbi:MAG: hypothetical protein B6244_04060 [Candidatus Cloacimonetes bacterium 4572_55]|nr:MAG: hypothetical protein B6244_04060 [Candidatus Cloacimonetes bacterium 4572_55]
MVPFFKLVNSTVGRKFIMGLTALSLCGFVVVHLVGNLTLFAGKDSQLFNEYAHHLISLGVLLYVAEVGLALLFLVHIVIGISIWLQKRQARPQNYIKQTPAGGTSEMTFYSKNMIWTGLIVITLAVMIVLGFHLRHGFWSAFQSLGLQHPRYSPIIFAIGILFAIAMAAGFLVIPIWIFLMS